MINNIKSLFKILSGKEIRGEELKSLVYSMGSGNHSIFEYFVKKYDPSVSLSYCSNYSEKLFLNEGRGWGTLKPYRILNDGKTKVFEKIFFNNSNNLTSALFFAEHQDRLLQDTAIKAPRLVEKIKGERLTILLYAFWDLEKIPSKDTCTELKSKTLDLCKNFSPSLQSGIADEGLSSPAGRRVYHPKRDLLMEEFEKIEPIAQSFPVYFQHLDLGEENVFLNDMVIDWDNSGHYNLGIDFGRLLLSYYILHPDLFFQNYTAEVQDYHSKCSSGIPFEKFYPVVLFYFIILFHGHHATEHSVDKIGSVTEDLRRSLAG